MLHLWQCAVTQVGVRRLSFTTHRYKPVILRPRRQVWCSLIDTNWRFLLVNSEVGSFWKNTGYNFISFAPRLQYWLLRAVTWRRQLIEYWQTDCDHVNRMMQCSLRIMREGAAAILCRYPSWINGLQTVIGDHKNTIFSFDFKVINTIFDFWILAIGYCTSISIICHLFTRISGMDLYNFLSILHFHA